jgi:MinD-like ATPase involved in chromosome partitioning or flagellar assembly
MGNVIAFVPTSGGVGSSTLAAAVAVRAAAAGRTVVAVDLDPLAGCLDVVFGLEQEPGWRWPELADVAGVVDGLGLADELPVSCGVPVLSGRRDARWEPRSASGSGIWSDGRAGNGSDSGSDSGPDSTSDGWLDTLPDVVAGLADAHDLTVLDLPRDPAVLDAVALLVDALVVVVGTQVPQLAAASAVVSGTRGLLRRLRDEGRAWEAEPLLPIEPWVVLRGRRVEADLEDLVMDDLDVPLVATIGDDRRLIAEVAEGLPPGARGRGEVVRAADELLLRLTDQAVAA